MVLRVIPASLSSWASRYVFSSISSLLPSAPLLAAVLRVDLRGVALLEHRVPCLDRLRRIQVQRLEYLAREIHRSQPCRRDHVAVRDRGRSAIESRTAIAGRD